MPARAIDEIRKELYATAEDTNADIARGALWIAAEKYPELDLDRYLGYLDSVAKRISGTIPPDAPARLWREAISAELFQNEGFRGNSEDYYDPRNSYLNEVIDRRTGIPITLSVIYMSIARKLGREAYGLNLPGHFLIALDGEAVDPFHGGKLIDRNGLLAQLKRAQTPDPEARLRELFANPATTRSILARMLVNLRSNHLRQKELEEALSTVDRLVNLDPENALWLRERGALFQALDCASAAVNDLETYLVRAPDDPEADVIRAAIEKLRSDLPSLQ